MGVPEVKKDFEWCPHCNPGSGCTIYQNRPVRCRDFNCQWLKDERFLDYWYPKTAGIIVDTKVEADHTYVLFVVDPRTPGRWREEPYFSDIKKVARAGLDGRLGAKWTTVILVKNDRIPIVL